LICRQELLSGAFGRLQRVDLLCLLSHARADMGGQIAVSVLPFGDGLRAGGTIPTRIDLDRPGASLALLHDFKAYTTFVSTALGCHEGTFHAFSNRRTFH
jgi:hypothetical protein